MDGPDPEVSQRERESFIRNNLHNGVVSGAARGQALRGPMWAGLRERERERERKRERERERERKRERGRERECVCVCVCVREREKERVCV